MKKKKNKPLQASRFVLLLFDLDANEGETFVLLGGSGSGKTVLMKHLEGLLQPDEGSVVIDGTT